MINKDEEIPIEIKKMWFRMAKRLKIVDAIYKLDNTLKNCKGFEKDGFIKYLKDYHNYYTNLDAVGQRLVEIAARFSKCSFKETTQIDYWFHNRKTKINFNNYDYD